VETDQEKLAYLERLAEELTHQGISAQVVSGHVRPYLKAANADTPSLNERVLCERANDDSWVFWWPSRSITASPRSRSAGYRRPDSAGITRGIDSHEIACGIVGEIAAAIRRLIG
jgi:hypothetical protein